MSFSLTTTFTIRIQQLIKTIRLIFTGTRKNQDLEIYCQKFHLENYDTILILCEGCFTQNDCLLTEKVKAMEKPFIFVRTKIDQDISNENRKSSFNENAFLSKTRQKCVESLQEFGGGDEVVFLISNHKPDKWDFALLTVAILDGLTLLAQQESLALSLDFLTTKSKKVLKRKVDILRGKFPPNPFSTSAVSFPYVHVLRTDSRMKIEIPRTGITELCNSLNLLIRCPVRVELFNDFRFSAQMK